MSLPFPGLKIAREAQEVAESSSHTISCSCRDLAARLFIHFIPPLRSFMPPLCVAIWGQLSVCRQICPLVCLHFLSYPSYHPVCMLVFPWGASELCPIMYRVMSFTQGSARARCVMKWLLSSLLPRAARGQRCYFTKQTPSERCALAMRGRSQENITFPFEC